MLRAVTASLVLCVAASASATPLRVRNAAVVRVKVGSDSKAGLSLRAEEHGWRLKLDGAAALQRLSVIDVTPGTPAQTLSLKVVAGEAMFDAVRFQGGHVYRISNGADAAAYVYLQPSAALAAQPKAGPGAGTGRLDFDDGDRVMADESTIEPAKKGAL